MLGLPRSPVTAGEMACATLDPDSHRVRTLAIAADQRAAAQGSDCSATVLWHELAHARWSLVDEFEAEGRRYLIARSLAHTDKPELALDTLDRIILGQRAAGAALKVIAGEVGLSISTVARRLRLAMRRLGLRNAADLAALFRSVVR